MFRKKFFAFKCDYRHDLKLERLKHEPIFEQLNDQPNSQFEKRKCRKDARDFKLPSTTFDNISTCKAGTFKSKVQLAIEILTEAIQSLPVKPTVLMDAWYTCAPILNLIAQSKWTFLAAIKRNRLVEINGKKISLRHLAKGPRKCKTICASKKRCFRVAKLLVHLPKIGTVLLFISRSKKDGIRFFITNNLKMTESQMVALYLQRVWIETFHQDIKQHLGFGEVFMRSWDGVQTHWTLVGIAYNLIALWNGKRSRSFRQMIRHFRDAVDPNAVLCL